MKRATAKTRVERVIVSLPRPLVRSLRTFAEKYRDGNKSGFVADAVRAHIERLRRLRHTAKLRESYAEASKQCLAVAREWESLDLEAWSQIEARAPSKRRKRQR